MIGYLKKQEEKLKEKENIILCLHSEIDLKIELLEKKSSEHDNG